MSKASGLEGRDEVLDALEALQLELAAGAQWENGTLEQFLESLGALLGSIEYSYTNVGREVPSSPWSLVADALRGARSYE